MPAGSTGHDFKAWRTQADATAAGKPPARSAQLGESASHWPAPALPMTQRRRPVRPATTAGQPAPQPVVLGLTGGQWGTIVLPFCSVTPYPLRSTTRALRT